MPTTADVMMALLDRHVDVLSHSDWGSRYPALYQNRRRTHPHALLPDKPVDTLWNHITVTFDSGVLIGDFKEDCRMIERIGYERFGSGVSYNFLIDRNASRPRVAIGQLIDAKGTHTVNHKRVGGYAYNQNKMALAVAWVGMPGDRLNDNALEAMIQLRAALIEVGALTRSYDDVPHSLVAWKDCPTDELRKQLPALKKAALAAVNGDEFDMATLKDLEKVLINSGGNMKVKDASGQERRLSILTQYLAKTQNSQAVLLRLVLDKVSDGLTPQEKKDVEAILADMEKMPEDDA